LNSKYLWFVPLRRASLFVGTHVNKRSCWTPPLFYFEISLDTVQTPVTRIYSSHLELIVLFRLLTLYVPQPAEVNSNFEEVSELGDARIPIIAPVLEVVTIWPVLRPGPVICGQCAHRDEISVLTATRIFPPQLVLL